VRCYRIRRAAEITHDFDLIEGYLVQAYQDLGDSLDHAAERATARIDEALATMRSFEKHPHRGTEHPELRSGIRSVTNKRFIFYFEIDEPRTEVLADPDAQPLNEDDAGRLIKLVDVKKLRERLGLTQEVFGAAYRIPLGTLRDREQRRKPPDAPARAYLTVIARDPASIATLLRDAA
jgi:toxin ParE1/3/4